MHLHLREKNNHLQHFLSGLLGRGAKRASREALDGCKQQQVLPHAQAAEQHIRLGAKACVGFPLKSRENLNFELQLQNLDVDPQTTDIHFFHHGKVSSEKADVHRYVAGRTTSRALCCVP